MKNSKTTKKKWEEKMKNKEPLQCWIVNIMSSRNLRTSQIHLFYNLQLFYWHFLEHKRRIPENQVFGL